MKRILIFTTLALVCAGIGRAAYEAAQPPQPPLSKYVPAGALLYLEAQDLSSLLEDWNSSAEKKQWLATSNYEVFSRSRLFLRLKGASDQFAVAAGFPPNMNFLSQVAGTRSALALYDIGNLEFLYVTYLPSAKSMQTTLWQTRAKFEPRSAGGVTFYVRRDPESQKEVAFAVSGDYLLLATREDLLAGALQSMSEDATKNRIEARTIESEPWWSQSVASAGPAGDLRMVMNLEKIVPSPYFRTYWVQQNITDMKQYSAAVSDLFRSNKEYREERVLLRKTSPPQTPAEGLESVADLVRLIPESAGVYEAKANPSADSCFDLIETKLLAPHLGPAPASETAPQVQLTSGETGSGSDLETRIDRAAVERPAAPQSTSALKDLFDKTQILASLQIQTTQIQTTQVQTSQTQSTQSQSTERDQSEVFIRIHSAIVLTAASDWNEATVQSALADFVRPGLTASRYGVEWQQKSGYAELDGLWPLATSVRGRYLVVADDPGLLDAILANFKQKPNLKAAVLVAGFNHEREQSNFTRFAALVDRPSVAQFNGSANANSNSNDRQPQFFAENVASLSRTLTAVSAERIMVRVEGDKVLQTVTYAWSR
ncbi:MAG: hypothetical protein WBQ43_05490 [Terriglobales bacterium]